MTFENIDLIVGLIFHGFNSRKFTIGLFALTITFKEIELLDTVGFI